jgi:TPR repeat protein
MLAQGIIEQPMDGKKLARAKVLIDTAARQPIVDPYAYYLQGHTKQAVDAGYIPAMYMRSLQEIESSRSQFSPEQQSIIDTMLTTLKKYKLPDETRLPVIQNRISKTQQEEPDQKRTIAESLTTLQNIITCYIQNPADTMSPWAIRACYALSMVQAAHAGKFCADKDIQPISIAVREGFEPAIYEFIRSRMLAHGKNCDTFLEQFKNFKSAAQRLHDTAHMGIIDTASVESLIEDAIICIHFHEEFFEYIYDINSFNDTLHSTLRALTAIDETTHNYKARCLQAIIILNRRTQESLARAYDLLEPLFNNSDIQHFIAKHTCLSTKKFLLTNTSNPKASFLIGLMLCAKKGSQQKALHYFILGADKKHVYSSLSAATMILKGFDSEKNQYDAAFYYKQVLDSDYSQDFKNNVLAILKNVASSDCIPVHCLYLTTLLEDPKKLPQCEEIIAIIETLDQPIFKKYIDCFSTNHRSKLLYLTEQGNTLASRLLGYIFFAQVQGSKGFNLHELQPYYLYQLHSSLGKLRNHATTPYSCAITSSIAFSLAQYYQSLGNNSNALRLYTIATEHGHIEAPYLATLLRLKQPTGNSFRPEDIHLITKLAEQGNIEAQEVLAKLCSGSYMNIEKIDIDTHLKFSYLTNVETQGKADPICMIQLAKMLCSQNEDPDIEHNEQRAFELFKRACQQGYHLQEEDYRIFGMVAFNVKQDELAIDLLEHSKQDKTVLWVRAILYLKNPDSKNIRFQKALCILDRVLRIENDDIEIPDGEVENCETVQQALRPYVGYDLHATEIFLRLCYAEALDERVIEPSEYLHLLSLLENKPTLSH